LTKVLVSASRGDQKAKNTLKSYLEDKHNRTNEKNLDTTGLDRIIEILKGLVSLKQKPDPLLSSLRSHLETAVLNISASLRNSDMRRKNAIEAKSALGQAAKLL
jgi:hypothetical protein